MDRGDVRIIDYLWLFSSFSLIHHSWFQDLTYHILKKNKSALVWSDKNHHHSILTGDFLYLRISKNEKRWLDKIKEEERNNQIKDTNDNSNRISEERLDFAIIVVDKPTRVNRVLKLLELPERAYHGHIQWSGKVIMCVDLNAFFPAL